VVVFLDDESKLVSHQSQVFMEKECFYFLNHALNSTIRMSLTGIAHSWLPLEVFKLVRLLGVRFNTTLRKFMVKYPKFSLVRHRRHECRDLGLAVDFFALKF